MGIITDIYQYLRCHTGLLMAILAVLVCLAALGVSRLRFSEDITDFLPLNANDKANMELYGQLSDADRIIIIFEKEGNADIDDLLNAVDHFADLAQDMAPTTQIDIDAYLTALDSFYARIPYYLVETDYARLSDLLSPDSIDKRLSDAKTVLGIPMSGIATRVLVNDPLHLFDNQIADLKALRVGIDGFEIYDGYMVSKDHSRAIAYCTSPHGARETHYNSTLVDSLKSVCRTVSDENPNVNIRLSGAPVIAVQNAQRIKTDSFIALGISAVLIIALLAFLFRSDLRGIGLIILTIVFGWLCGMAALGFIHSHTSLIIIGIGSVITGIAVNYPLHLVLHSHYTADVAANLREEATPLIIGNITTLGAFLALLPMASTALRDLGIFATAMLLGTIAFTVIVLPQMMSRKQPASSKEQGTKDKEQGIKNKVHSPLRYVFYGIFGISTIALAYIGRDVTFDSDLSNINYMTASQRADFRYFEQASHQDTLSTTLYVAHRAGSLDEASERALSAHYPEGAEVHSITRYIPSVAEQHRRLDMWNSFWDQHREPTLNLIQQSAKKHGLTPVFTQRFMHIVNHHYAADKCDLASEPANTFFRGYYADNTQQTDYPSFSIVDRLSVPIHEIDTYLLNIPDSFTPTDLNSKVAGILSDDFNYLGIICSLIVFLFLWVTMRDFRLALIAFAPMVLAWCWIFGLMKIFDLQFNIVNVILATFIFGQGDDYTIFVLEGLIRKRDTGQDILPQFRREIIVSAIIMLLGIGVLVFAEHPAMYSLGAVTLIGMGAVVLMALVVTPALFALNEKITIKYLKTLKNRQN